MISAAVLGILMMLSAVIIDANSNPSFELLGIEWKQGAHVIGWVFWVGFLIFLFGGGSSTKKVIVEHKLERPEFGNDWNRSRRYRP
jgi:hypothetical protein